MRARPREAADTAAAIAGGVDETEAGVRDALDWLDKNLLTEHDDFMDVPVPQNQNQEEVAVVIQIIPSKCIFEQLLEQVVDDSMPQIQRQTMEVLKASGAEFVVNSFLPSFKEDLLAAVKATEATVAFDTTGGGTLATDILTISDTSLRQPYPDQERVQQRSVEQIVDGPMTPVADCGVCSGIRMACEWKSGVFNNGPYDCDVHPSNVHWSHC